MYYRKVIEGFGAGLKPIAAAKKESRVKLEFRLMKRGVAVAIFRPDEDLTRQINLQMS
jgi:hypothetical protein